MMFITALIGLGLGLAAGYVSQRSRFCIQGGIRDLFLFKQTYLLKGTLAAMAVFSLVHLLGGYRHVPWGLICDAVGLASLVGGVIMGIGMVLAAGCPFRLITRTAEGDLTALVGIAGFVAGIAVFSHLMPFLQRVFAPYVFRDAATVGDLIRLLFGG